MIVRKWYAWANQALLISFFPEHLKYEQDAKKRLGPHYSTGCALFLMTPDTLLIATGFSFADAHISARIDECLSAKTHRQVSSRFNSSP